MIVRSRSDAIQAVIGITLLSMLASVLVAWVIATLLGDQIKLVFALGVPAILVPFFVVPLVRANLRLYQTRAELEWLVRTDYLTGLANRRHFLEEAMDLFASPATKNDDVAVMMVDVDHFKKINDSCGHDNGDRVLKLVAAAIRAVTEEEHPDRVLVGRLGGEEFAVLAHRMNAKGAVRLAERLCQTMRHLECGYCGKVEPVPTISVGIAMRQPGETVAQVLKAADIAVYEAKARGRDCWCLSQTGSEPEALLDAADTADGECRVAGGMIPVHCAHLPVDRGVATFRSAIAA